MDCLMHMYSYCSTTAFRPLQVCLHYRTCHVRLRPSSRHKVCVTSLPFKPHKLEFSQDLISVRIAPCCCRLVRPIYPRLLDHPSVEQYPAVRGMAKPLFFWSHRELEGGQGSNEGRSKFNNHEVEAAVALARCATCSTSYICINVAVVLFKVQNGSLY